MAFWTLNDQERAPLIALDHLCFDYRGAPTLRDVHLTLRRGEIHALVGEHGAGKSSLCLILAGLLRPASGSIALNGERVAHITPKLAAQHGIRLVHQHHPLFENLSIAENLFVPKEAEPSPIYNHKKLVVKAREYFDRLGLTLNPELPLKTLDPADRNLISILKQNYLQPQLLILDETLDTLKTDALHTVARLLETLKQQGTAILFVTHRVDEIYQIADTVTVVKDGSVFFSDAVKNIDKINLIKFAYTEISKPVHFGITKEEFYQLLKYNEAILQNLPVNLLVIDNDIRVKLINERARALFDLSRDDYYNLPLSALFEPNNRDIYELIARAFESGQEENFLNVGMNIGAAQQRNNLTITPIYDGAALIGAILIIEDISEQERLREQVVFSEKLASTGLLAAGVAHEINNPLEIIHNYLEYLRYEIEPPHLREILESIQRQAEAIAQIVSNLVIFSDQRNAGVEICDVRVIIERIISLIRHQAKQRQIAISFDKGTDALQLQVNPTEMQQVLLNLFKNSFDAMPTGGEIRIATTARLQAERPVMELVFRDTGSGIQGVNPQDIFLPFYSTKSGKPGHLGLGLSVSYGIIAKYRGEISVKNLDTGGCQFTITLPLADTDT